MTMGLRRRAVSSATCGNTLTTVDARTVLTAALLVQVHMPGMIPGHMLLVCCQLHQKLCASLLAAGIRQGFARA